MVHGTTTKICCFCAGTLHDAPMMILEATDFKYLQMENMTYDIVW